MNADRMIYITMDMDWACNEVMDFLYDLLEEYDVSATINITNEFSSLQKYRKSRRIDLGIHPNFNMLINGSGG